MHTFPMGEMSDEDFQNLYAWIDEIPLSRAKRNITRDFSDGGGKGCLISMDPRMIVVFDLCSNGSGSSKAFCSQAG